MAGPEHNHCRGQMVSQEHTVELSVQGYAGCAFQLYGTWTGTVTFEGAEVGGQYQPLAALPLSEASGVVTTATANGVWRSSCAALVSVRARLSTGGTGTVLVGIRATVAGVGPMSLASGGGGGGAITAADGALATEGLIADAKAVGDTVGTLNAHLRGIDYLINEFVDTALHQAKVNIQNATIAVTQSGAWSVTDTPVAVTGSAPATATSAGASGNALALNASRKYVDITNTDAAVTVYLAFGGSAAVVGSGICLAPGASVRLQTTQAIQAIGVAVLAIQEWT